MDLQLHPLEQGASRAPNDFCYTHWSNDSMQIIYVGHRIIPGCCYGTFLSFSPFLSQFNKWRQTMRGTLDSTEFALSSNISMNLQPSSLFFVLWCFCQWEMHMIFRCRHEARQFQLKLSCLTNLKIEAETLSTKN